jgi:hypothetical protein
MLNFFPKFFYFLKYVLYIPGAYAPMISFGFPLDKPKFEQSLGQVSWDGGSTRDEKFVHNNIT